MSLESLNWAWKQPVPNSSAKFLLLALANRANPDDQGRVVTYPSASYLSKVTAQNIKTVVANMAKLRAWGLIEDTGRRVGRTNQVIVYALNCPPDLFTELTQKGTTSEKGRRPKSSVNTPVFTEKHTQKRVTDSAFNRSSIQKQAGDKSPKANSADTERQRKAEGKGLQHVAELLGIAQ